MLGAFFVLFVYLNNYYGEGFILSIIALAVAVYYSKKAINIHQEDSKIRNS